MPKHNNVPNDKASTNNAKINRKNINYAEVEAEIELSEQYDTLRQLIAVLQSPNFSHTLACARHDKPFDYRLLDPTTKVTGPQQFQKLAWELNETMKKIHAASGKLNKEVKETKKLELNEILTAKITFNYYSNSQRRFSNFLFHFTTPFITGRYGIETKLKLECTMQEALDVHIPKTLVLIAFDAMIKPVQNKKNSLVSKTGSNDENNDVCSAVAKVLEAIDIARSQIVAAERIDDGLLQAEKTIADVYTDEINNLFISHSDHPIVNAALELLSKLTGYFLFIITYPARVYDDKVIKTYVDGWFEKRTNPLNVFSVFKDRATSQNLKKDAGLSEEKMVLVI